MSDKEKISLEKIEEAVEKNGMAAPVKRVDIEFCELYLEGRKVKEIGDMLGLDTQSAKSLEKIYKGWLLSKVLERKDLMKADVLLRVAKRISEKEADKDRQSYSHYLQMQWGMLNEDVNKGIQPPKHFMTIIDKQDIKDAEIVENKNATNSGSSAQVATTGAKQ